MVAVKPEIKPSHKIVQLIAKIERLSGSFDSLVNSGILNKESKDQAHQKNILAALCLDHTSPAPLTHPILSYLKNSSPTKNLSYTSILSDDNLNQLNGCKSSFTDPFELSEQGLLELFNKISGYASEETGKQSEYRTTPSPFFSHENQRIFTTVSPFLVKRRLRELIEWLSEELYTGEIHPLIIIGTYHLLFLQLHPFRSGNHRIALSSSWHLLNERGYEFISYSELLFQFLEQSNQYYNTLRHSERSTFGDWSTINVWLEFYLNAILEAAAEVSNLGEQKLNETILSPTQRKILETVRAHGALSREKLVTETGINLSTVKYNLSLLAEKGHLKREGGGRSTFYTVNL